MSVGGYKAASFRVAAVKGLAAAGDVKASSGALRSLHVANLDATAVWVQVFDAADHTHVTLGTTAPNLSIHLAASADMNLVGLEWVFQNGLVLATTTTDGGAVSPSTGVAVSATYF